MSPLNLFTSPFDKYLIWSNPYLSSFALLAMNLSTGFDRVIRLMLNSHPAKLMNRQDISRAIKICRLQRFKFVFTKRTWVRLEVLIDA